MLSELAAKLRPARRRVLWISAPVPMALIAASAIGAIFARPLPVAATFAFAYFVFAALCMTMFGQFCETTRATPDDHTHSASWTWWLGLIIIAATGGALADGASWLAVLLAFAWPVAVFALRVNQHSSAQPKAP